MLWFLKLRERSGQRHVGLADHVLDHHVTERAAVECLQHLRVLHWREGVHRGRQHHRAVSAGGIAQHQGQQVTDDVRRQCTEIVGADQAAGRDAVDRHHAVATHDAGNGRRRQGLDIAHVQRQHGIRRRGGDFEPGHRHAVAQRLAVAEEAVEALGRLEVAVAVKGPQRTAAVRDRGATRIDQRVEVVGDRGVTGRRRVWGERVPEVPGVHVVVQPVLHVGDATTHWWRYRTIALATTATAATGGQQQRYGAHQRAPRSTGTDSHLRVSSIGRATR